MSRQAAHMVLQALGYRAESSSRTLVVSAWRYHAAFWCRDLRGCIISFRRAGLRPRHAAMRVSLFLLCRTHVWPTQGGIERASFFFLNSLPQCLTVMGNYSCLDVLHKLHTSHPGAFWACLLTPLSEPSRFECPEHNPRAHHTAGRMPGGWLALGLGDMGQTTGIGWRLSIPPRAWRGESTLRRNI